MRYFIYIVIIIFCLHGCIEPFQAKTQGFEGVLVIDARLTDENKQHIVSLSRARAFEDDNIDVEQNATIMIKDDLGNTYEFEEILPGKYTSTTTFKAQQGRGYQLNVLTADGTSYTSEVVQTPQVSILGDLYSERGIKDDNTEGVSIVLNDSGIQNSKYRRYEYDETYKIIAPDYSPFEFELEQGGIVNDFSVIRVKPRVENVRTCYRTDSSTDIILLNTENLKENNSSRLILRFLDRNNYIISHRYSILVKQFVLTSDAFSYYNKLNDFSTSESIFNEIQPGFLEGNISSSSNESIKVLGYFEVASVSERRIFFNYANIFPNDSLPPYKVNCDPIGAPFVGKATRIVLDGENIVLGPNDILVLSPTSIELALIEGIKNNAFTYLGIKEDFLEDDRTSENGFSIVPPYFTKFTPCGDCTVLGSTEVPDFWIE